MFVPIWDLKPSGNRSQVQQLGDDKPADSVNGALFGVPFVISGSVKYTSRAPEKPDVLLAALSLCSPTSTTEATRRPIVESHSDGIAISNHTESALGASSFNDYAPFL